MPQEITKVPKYFLENSIRFYFSEVSPEMPSEMVQDIYQDYKHKFEIFSYFVKISLTIPSGITEFFFQERSLTITCRISAEIPPEILIQEQL